jgi:hypothetical protein
MTWLRCASRVKGLQNLLTTEPLLSWREIPAQNPKDGDAAKYHTSL